MLADWSVAMSEAGDDPVVVVPWGLDGASGGSNAATYVDLSAAQKDIEEIPELLLPEARAHPALGAVLREWNQANAVWRTLKCDAFVLEREVLEALCFELGMEAAAGFGSYVDVAVRTPEVFSSFSAHENLLRVLTACAGEIEIPEEIGLAGAGAEFVLRRCHLLDEDAEGYCISVYVNGVGESEVVARAAWAAAITALRRPLVQAATQAVLQVQRPAS